MIPIVALAVIGQIPSPLSQPLITQLPAAMAMPSDSLDESADLLAQKIAGHKPDAGPALMAALKACGLSVIGHKDRHVIQAPMEGKGMGLAIEDTEVLAVLNQRPDATGFALKSLSDIYSTVNPTPKEVIHQEIADSMIKAESSPNKSVRFFAQFVDALSAYGDEPWSFKDMGTGMPSAFGGSSGRAAMMKASSNAAAVSEWFRGQFQEMLPQIQGKVPTPDVVQKLHAVQAGMVAAAGAQLAASPYKMGADGKPEVRPLADKPLSMLQMLLITRRTYADAFDVWVNGRKKAEFASVEEPQDPEAGRDNTGTIMDFGGTVETTVFNEGVFKNAGEAASAWAEATGNITAIAALAKLVDAYSKLEMKLDPNPIELTRRKDTQPGTPKKMTFTLSINNPGQTVGNIGRSAMWFSGVDLSTPDNGPIQGSFVDWSLDQPADALGSFVQFVSPGQAGDGGAKTSNKTDVNGQATLSIQTTPQKNPLPESAQSYPRRARVMIKATLKGSNLQQDLADAFNTVVGAATGGSGGGFKATIADMIARTSFLSTRMFPVKVTDWKEPLWEGTFSAEIKGTATKEGGAQGVKWNVHRTVKGRIVSALQDIPQSVILNKYGGGPYNLVMDSLHDADILDTSTSHGMTGGGCMGKEAPWSVIEADRGPIAQIDAPYSLTGSFLKVQFVHEGGKDIRRVTCSGGFSLPVRGSRKSTGLDDPKDPHPPETWIEYADIPVNFSVDVNGLTPSTGFRDTNSKEIPIEIEGLKGTLTCVISWELHAKK